MAKWEDFMNAAAQRQEEFANAPHNVTGQRGPLPTVPNAQNSGANTNATEAGAAGGIWAGGLIDPSRRQGNETQKKPQTTTYTVNAGNQPYVDQLNALYDQIMGRKPFQYDLNGDLLYKQMADRYTQMGQMAMRDETGTAAGLTGGYGNSYATQVGNQAYQQYLTALNDNIPSLYDRALQAYMAQGDQMLQQYQLAAEHPGIIEALKPRTYTVTPKEETEGTPATGATYGALLASLLNGGQIGATPYQSNGATTAVNPTTTYNVPVNPTAESQIYYEWLQRQLNR